MFRLLQDTSESEISNYCQLFHSLDRPFGPWPFVDSRKGSCTLKLCNTIPELAPKISHCVMSFELLKKEVVNWSENFLLDWGCDYYDSKFFRSVRKFVMVSVVQVTGYGHLQGLIGAKSKHQFFSYFGSTYSTFSLSQYFGCLVTKIIYCWPEEWKIMSRSCP